MNHIPQVYLGWDSREVEAFEVAEHTLRQNASGPVNVIPLKLPRLEHARLLTRPREKRVDGKVVVGQAARGALMWDVISDAPMSTEFAVSRFLTPLLAQAGVAIFMDSDVIVMGDVYQLQEQAERQDHLALWCVQHQHNTGPNTKMDGQAQTYYQRKNWSSVMVFNCDHWSNWALTLDMVNILPGRDLHAFKWLHDRLIGKLDPEWNWLVGVQEKPPEPKIAHYTLGGPWLPNWERREHDDLWLSARARLGPRKSSGDPRPGQGPV